MWVLTRRWLVAKSWLCVFGLMSFFGTATVCIAQEAKPELPAFPGAEGFGAISRGGRGGRIIKVTNLNADGPGSLAAACAEKGPRIVVFDVSGVIPVKAGKQGLLIRDGNITIAGQTAPGAGITIEGALRLFNYDPKGQAPAVNDVIVRFLRCRTRRGLGEHAVEFAGVDRFILDHLSASWGQDECMGMTQNHRFTIQWCAIEETEIHLEGGLKRAEPHNFGMIMGYTKDGACSLHHDLFAHHAERAPLDNGDTRLDHRNNVFYNMRGGYPQESKTVTANVVGNYVIAGPGALVGIRCYRPPTTYAMPELGPGRKGRSYAAGNYYAWGWASGYVRPWKGEGGREVPAEQLAEKPFPFAPVTTDTAEGAYDLVLAQAGCLPRDAVSKRTVREVQTRTGSWGRHVPNAGLMEGLTPGQPPRDSDGDGMPDEWEGAHGLNPNDPTDAGKSVAAGASKGDRHRGYTYIEFYINERADDLVADALNQARLVPRRDHPDYGPADGLYGSFKPVPELVSAITTTGRTEAAWYAVEELSRLGAAAKDAVPEFTRALGSDSAQTVAFAAWALGAIGPAASDAVPALIAELGRDYQVEEKGWCCHGYAAWALGRMGFAARDAVPALAKAMEDRIEPHAQRPAAWALSQMGPYAAPALDKLLAALEHNDQIVRWHAGKALACLGEPAVPGLARAIATGKAPAMAVYAAAGILPPAKACIPSLVKLAGDKDPLLRIAAAKALSRIDPHDLAAVAAIVGLLNDDHAGVRHQAACALGFAHPLPAGAAEALERAVGDPEPEVRYAAVRALGGAALVRALQSPADALTRAQCARSLGDIGKGVNWWVAPLVKALSDASADVRRESAWSLAVIGVADPSVLAALAKALEDDDYLVRAAARAAAEKLRSVPR